MCRWVISPFFVIFAVLDVSLAVNLCINCSFFTFIMNYSTINSSIRNLNLSVPTLDGVPPGPSLKAPMNLSEKLWTLHTYYNCNNFTRWSVCFPRWKLFSNLFQVWFPSLRNKVSVTQLTQPTQARSQPSGNGGRFPQFLTFLRIWKLEFPVTV